MFRMFSEDAVWTAESCLVSSLSNRQQIILMIGRTKWRSALAGRFDFFCTSIYITEHVCKNSVVCYAGSLYFLYGGLQWGKFTYCIKLR